MATVVCSYLRCGATINNNIENDNVPTKFCYKCGHKLIDGVPGLCADKYYRSAKAAKEFEIEGYSERYSIGKGRYGEVHLVSSRRNKKRYARKVTKINPELKHSPELDAECLLNLNHPNIAIAYERFFDDNKLAVIMEYFPRGSLKDLLIDHTKPLSEITLTKTDKTCIQSIIHRNLKPSNLLITAERTIKISDFGYAKLLMSDEDSITCPHIADVEYCAPEVLEPLKCCRYGKKVDNWSVGVILYEMVTRKLPFVGDDVDEIKSSIRNEEPEMNCKELKRYTPPLKDLCIALLQKNPDNRPDTQQCSNWFQQVGEHIAGLEEDI